MKEPIVTAYSPDGTTNHLRHHASLLADHHQGVMNQSSVEMEVSTGGLSGVFEASFCRSVVPHCQC